MALFRRQVRARFEQSLAVNDPASVLPLNRVVIFSRLIPQIQQEMQKRGIVAIQDDVEKERFQKAHLGRLREYFKRNPLVD